MHHVKQFLKSLTLIVRQAPPIFVYVGRNCSLESPVLRGNEVVARSTTYVLRGE